MPSHEKVLEHIGNRIGIMRDIRRIRIRYTAGVVCIFLCISLLLAGCQGRAGEVIPVLEMTETDEDTEADETDQMNEDQGENREGSSEDMNMDKENAIQDVEYDPDQEFYITEITDEIFARMDGKSYKPDCTLPREDLKYLHVLHYDLHGEVQEGEMVVNTHIAEDVLEILRELYDAEYPIEKIRLVDEYNAEDELSMEDNNSSSFNFRFISYTTTVSKHGLGLAVDIVDEGYRATDDKQAETPTAQWLEENAWKYGFIQRYPPDTEEITGFGWHPWHYRYVGEGIAESIHSLGITLEEYLSLFYSDEAQVVYDGG